MQIRICGLLLCLWAMGSYETQAQIDHWETVVQETDMWDYFEENAAPAASWRSDTFAIDSNWQQGIGGFGFGDGDDNTITNAVLSIYIRRDFVIVDTSVIEQAILNMDYDDGFIAYINGVEVARGNLSVANPAFNTPADGEHEAWMYQGNDPEAFTLDKAFLRTFLRNGSNTIAIEVHNRAVGSSDISLRPFLSLGITDQSFNYLPTPAWFSAPVAFVSSNIPIIRIETAGNQAIVNDPKVSADMYVYANGLGNRNYLSDAPAFAGKIAIEIRGQSSQSFPKKCYGFETTDSVGNEVDTSFLDLPKEQDWILYGPYTDKTLLRNDLIMKMGVEMGRYSSRMRWCEVVVNGDYTGVYQVMEKIKRDKNRVDIAKLTAADTTGEDLTGGYIFKIDKGWDGGWASNYDVVSLPGQPIYFQYVYPKADSLQPQQAQYIQSYVDSFEQAIAAPNYVNNAGKHYTEYIDLLSFVDNFIHNEVSRNVDGYRLSSYFHKDKNGKIVAGPLWDFNLSFGNGDYCDGWATSGWMYEEYCDNGNPFWWGNMLQDTLFQQTLRCRWDTLRQTVLDTTYLFDYIDSTVLLLDEAQTRNYQHWNILGIYVWPNPSPIPATYAEEISTLKQWIRDRLAWMDFVIYPITANCQPVISGTWATATDANGWTVYPNPSRDGRLYVRAHTAVAPRSVRLSLYSAAGRWMSSTTAVIAGDSPVEWEALSGAAAGVYWLQIAPMDGGMPSHVKVVHLGE